MDQYLKQARAAGLHWKGVESLNDDELLQRLQQTYQPHLDPRFSELMSRMPEMVNELGKRRDRMGRVTRQLLWEEYRAKCPDGYGYSQFCYHMQVFTEDSELSMHLTHPPGYKQFFDYAGDRPFLTDPETGAKTPVELYVSVLPAGALIYAESRHTQDTEDTIIATEHSFEYAGGVATVLVPDNLKAAIQTPNRYEATVNPTFGAFAAYYGCTVIPARVRRPKDKALVEAAVNLVYTRVLAPIRHQTFASIDDLNAAIWEQLDRLNDRPMQKIHISRRQRFEDVERRHLRPLPMERYVVRLFTQPITVQKNYHVFFPVDKHYYSVPYRYRKLKVVISYTHNEIEIYHKNERIAVHRREPGNHQYTTNHDHMPANHRFHADLNPDRLMEWAAAVGPETHQTICTVLASREVPEQAYRSCLGILSLRKAYSPQRLERACGRANHVGVLSYKSLERMLERGLDRIDDSDVAGDSHLPSHPNIRGKRAFAAMAQGVAE